MRQERTVQATIFEVFAGHQIGCELKAISAWLDGQRALVSLVAGDLRREGLRQTGRRGLPAETVLRCALLKQQRQLSYEELAFHLEDSASFRAFARLPLAWSPKKSVLHRTISAIRAETWEAVNRALIAAAQQAKVEAGAMLRIDSTVTAALMHEPSDSALLWDAVRLMTRLLRQATALPGAPALHWRDRRRLAKKRAQAIEYSRSKDNRRRLYRELIAATRATQVALQQAGDPADAERFLPMIERQIDRCGAPPRQVAADGGYAARPISPPPRRAASTMSPFTRSAAWRSKTWSRAAGSIASCATSAPGSRPGSPASSEPTVWHAVPGAGSITSRPTSGPRWWHTTWCCSPVSNQHSPRGEGG